MAGNFEERVKTYIKGGPAFRSFLSGKERIISCDTIEGFPLACLVHSVAAERHGRTICIVPTEDYAISLMEDLSAYSDMKFIHLPSDGNMLYSPYSSTRNEFARKSAEEEMDDAKTAVVVASLRSFTTPLLARNTLDGMTLRIRSGEAFDSAAVSKRLTEGGYYRSAAVTETGAFSLRGEVLDIFPYSFSNPVRVYLDWDTVDHIAPFDTATQTTDRKKGMREVRIPLMGGEAADSFGVSYESISSHIRDDDYFMVLGVEKADTGWKALEKEARIRFNEAYKKDPDTTLPEKYLFSWPLFLSSLREGFMVYDIMVPDHHHFSVEPSHSYFGNVKFFKDELSVMAKEGWSVTVVAPTNVQKERLENVFRDSQVDIVISTLQQGFQIPAIRYAVILDNEIFGRKKRRNKAVVETVSSPLDSFVSLKPGDYVVHVNYGIGQFERIERVKGSRNERDYIRIRYGEGETLFVPIEQANLIQKYIGNDGRPPKLDTMGGQGWTKKKEKARKSAEELASELLRLYAERERTHGFPFLPDNDWQVTFEASFPYTETPDQLRCIEEIKSDMEKDRCMDRLVCGDVGYGKTEIAFRAAFKAVMSGKQVAFLAPTVILARQHYENFVRRLGDFPVKAALSTRFVPSKEQRAVTAGIRDGSVDVLFGTHKILGKNMVFKDLGLLVVDEEQRFGVKDKEKIKKIKTNVDCLTLSATPIPRTLYMSLLKVRDMSLLTTAPRERHPIETSINEFDLTLIRDAIRRELERGGQVFYLHNRVEDLEEVAAVLRHAVPEAIIETAHGQMEAEDLEDTMHRFIYEGVQVLVSTTIIENGIDIPNVNTIIIDRADRLGLAQLYQLRGRVGRSDRKAYCLLFYPPSGAISDDAVKRLKVLSENTELGSGFKISMKDMEIRGAGNILGREQSGHLEAVGLDMYLKLIEEEIDRQTRSGDGEEKRDVMLELDYTGFIPESYIRDPSAKFEMYKKIASVETEGQLEGLRSEAENRFGPLPEEVESLFSIAEIKILCRTLKIWHLKETKGIADVTFGEVAALNPGKVVNLVTLSGGRVRLDPRRMDHLVLDTGAVSLRDKAQFILETLRRLV